MKLFLLGLVGFALFSSAWGKGRLVERALDVIDSSTENGVHNLKVNLPTVVQKDVGKGVPVVDPPEHIAGYFDLENTADGHMFYFFFQSRNKGADDPVVLWTNGGPGCSSEMAVFFENGPYKINDDLTLSWTDYGWETNHNMIFVDQPLNTGFSYSKSSKDVVHGEEGVSEDLLNFLWEFFEAHPEYADRDFYVTGESYAGHYVPATAHRIWLANKNGEGAKINLKGIAIGNGLTEPGIQYGAYSDFALEEGLISQRLHDSMRFTYPVCKKLADSCASGGMWGLSCSLALTVCQASQFTPIMTANPGINVYDIRIKCKGTLCYDFSIMDKYLNRGKIQKKLGVDREWVECSRTVYMAMLGDWMKSFSTDIADMLDDGIRVLIYAGDKDLICNWLGNRRWVDALNWSQSKAWAKAKDGEWEVDGEAAGKVKEVGPLVFAKVYNAGHMVPMDQGKNALDMITRFTKGLPFVGPAPSVAAEEGGEKVPFRLTDSAEKLIKVVV